MWRKLEHVSRCFTQKSVGVHGHTYVETLRRTAGRYDTSSSLSEKRIPTRTWPQSQVRSPSSPMPPFPPEVRWYGIWLSNVLAVRVLHDDVLQYRTANKKHLFRASLRFLFVSPKPGHFPTSSTSVSYPPKVSNRVLFARILRTNIFLLTAAILKGCPLLQMRRGAGFWQTKRRLPPATTSNRLCKL